jgi:hypothetical protein
MIDGSLRLYELSREQMHNNNWARSQLKKEYSSIIKTLPRDLFDFPLPHRLLERERELTIRAAQLSDGIHTTVMELRCPA